MTQTLAWNCNYCDTPITDRDGYLFVSRKQIARHVNGYAQWKRNNPGPINSTSALMEIPPRPQWITTHTACDPEPHTGDYWIPIDQFRTYRDVIDRTAHLLSKTWFANTDWEQLLRRVQQQ